MKVGFIGAGNMGSALARAVSHVLETEVYIYDKTEEKSQILSQELNANPSDLENIIKNCDFVFIGVKPNGISEVCSEIKNQSKNNPIIISMAAGVKINKLQSALGNSYKIIRIMPNTPVAVGAGLTAYSKNSLLTNTDVESFKSLMKYTGTVVEIEEEKIDAFSAISGCGPAYAYMFIDALASAAEKCGLAKEQAVFYASEMIRGAALMTVKTKESTESLKQKVCSPGGSTIEGVKVLEENDFSHIVAKAIEAAYKKTQELGKD